MQKVNFLMLIAHRSLALVLGLSVLQPAWSQNPCEGPGACDALLINKGRPWDYQVSTAPSPRTLIAHEPDARERSVVEIGRAHV